MLPERRSRILGAVSRCVLLRVRCLERANSVEHLAARGVDDVRAAGPIQRLETFRLTAAVANRERVEVVHRDGRGRAVENARRLCGHRYGAERGRSARLTR